MNISDLQPGDEILVKGVWYIVEDDDGDCTDAIFACSKDGDNDWFTADQIDSIKYNKDGE